jgi:hypothetical protein
MKWIRFVLDVSHSLEIEVFETLAFRRLWICSSLPVNFEFPIEPFFLPIGRPFAFRD